MNAAQGVRCHSQHAADFGVYGKNEKLEQVIMQAERKHKEIAARTAKALTSRRNGQEAGAAAETFAWLTTEMKMLIRDDSSQIAKIMTNGCNIDGIQSIMEVLNETGGG